MIERKDKRYVSCPVCGRLLMKFYGQCSVEITCVKCSRDIVVLVDNDRIMVLENRRSYVRKDKKGEVKVSISKVKKS